MSASVQAATRNIPVARPYVGRQEEEAVARVLSSGWLTQGPRVAEFERRFAEYVGAREAVAVSSCTAALHLALASLRVRPGDEVICPSLSFIASANAIVHAGATPVFADIDPRTYNLDPARVEEAVTSRTRAILAVHQVGMPAALGEMLEIAGRHQIPVIEDAACAVGAEYQGRRIGAPHGALACFSFHPRKVLTTGEGGMITSSDGDWAARLRRMRQHAMSVSDAVRHTAGRVVVETYDEVGYNYRMTDIQAAVGIVQLQRLDDLLARRRYLAGRYSEALAPMGWLAPPAEAAGCSSNFQSYMVRLRDRAPVRRDALMKILLERGISTRRGVMAIHRELPYRDARWDALLPETNAAANETIILPLYHQMTEEDQDYVIECIHHAGADPRN
ncbi:MAG TPA: DegT/DnrJ/EryC1/StrS family aminotransferase [Terriglobia bacterium]|nr:DegT/DnrJ/EryC1/StrS family aminotransferase [Terriglobia bacterium]